MMNDLDQVDEESTATTPPVGDLYTQLVRPFDVTFKDIRGGVELEYITGEQAISRLNEELGVLQWSFRLLEHGIHAEADEAWVLAELSVTIDGETTTRQQFGSQKIKRSRSSGTPMDIGFDLKGAGTDALKKCASLYGVGLYLWKKEAKEPTSGGYSPSNNGGGYGNNGGGNYNPPPAASNQAGGLTQSQNSGDAEAFSCEECGEPLTETRFKDGTNWPPSQLAVFGRRKHSRVLCMTDYRAANQAKRQAEEALQQVPF